MDSGGDASAMVFPGMGPVPFAEAARFLLVNPVARRMTAEASEVLGYPLIDRWREADGDYSEYAQVAFLVGCLALAEWAREEHGVDARVCAGPSFGGKAAAVHTGALPFADGVLMTARWARFLEDFSAGEHGHVVTQSFARVPAGELARITAELADRGAWHEVSCEVDEDFHMLSLGRDELDWLGKRIRAAGGLPLYTMYPPMHVSLFGPLRGRIESEVLGGLRFADPALPLIADQDGRAVDTGEEVRTMLADGFERPVRWPRVVAALRRHGVGTLYVCGHDALFGRVPVTRRNFTVVPADPGRHFAPGGGDRRRRAEDMAAAVVTAAGGGRGDQGAAAAAISERVFHSTAGEANVSTVSASSTKRTPYAFSNAASNSTVPSESSPRSRNAASSVSVSSGARKGS
ncbi:hypothetical protein SVIO_006060 [Streptomyces violaceusniger]|uniref:[acyl-carrier-protein] S-malonyltransferase n=1 Tax=Streptomyces violaceusniger TaxID=68280 RepID=A0A4D4KVY6_STRVO|nr:hypothetical protein SVIO_006060 [Streptomyces violaceusniger]